MPDLVDDRPGEACGVFGVFAPDQPVAKLTYLGLHALQHRGQESAGMAVSDGDTLVVDKDMGLVSRVFDERRLAALFGHVAVGHTRYSTTGESTWRNAQPVYRDIGGPNGVEFALGHNGNLTNTGALAAEASMLAGTVASDSDLIAELLAAELRTARAPDLVSALVAVLPRLQGAFSLSLVDRHSLIGVRDPNGFRPLCLGRLDGGGWVLASETPALDVVGATFLRELEPGEVVVIDGSGVRSLHPFPADRANPTLCLFEFVYFARPDSRLYGQNVHAARQRMGELLAVQAPLPPGAGEAMVMPVPESGGPAAQGFARASGIPYGDGLVKNRYIGRSFIAPTQALRADAVRMKLNPIRENVEGKRIVVVDDSIVRGTTQGAVIRMLREAGAAEVHLRVMSPPYRWPCFYGMDTGERSELLAADRSVEEVRRHLGADSLAFLDLDQLIEATGVPALPEQRSAGQHGFCTACVTGEYPVPVAPPERRAVLESNEQPAGGLEVELAGPALG